MPGHFENHVHAEASSFLRDNGADIFFGRIERVIGLHFNCELAPVFVDLDGEDGGCAYSSRHGDREQADGTTAGNGHGFRGDFSGQHRVHGVAERIEDGSILQRNRRI